MASETAIQLKMEKTEILNFFTITKIREKKIMFPMSTKLSEVVQYLFTILSKSEILINVVSVSILIFTVPALESMRQ